jgi:hypothetical protein
MIRLSCFQIVSPPVHRQGSICIWRIFALAMLAAGCTGTLSKSDDFDRHRYSQLVQPFDRRGQIYFDVIFSAAYPADDPVADAKRMAWLAGWLAQKQLCAGGHEVAIRRPFDYLEDNPAGFAQRWEIRCPAVPGS